METRKKIWRNTDGGNKYEEINACGNVWGNRSIFLDYSKPNALTLLIIPAVVKEDIQIIFKHRQRVINILCSFLKIFTHF